MNKIFTTKSIKNIAIALLIAIFFIADRFLKFLANDLGVQRVLINNLLSFDFTPNFYIAFSLPIKGLLVNALIIIITVVILFLLLIAIRKKYAPTIITGLAMMFLGSISNIYDRMNLGFVIDYFNLRYFTVFNLADALITVGAILIVIGSSRETKKSRL